MKRDNTYLPQSAVGWFDAFITLPFVIGVFFLFRHAAISDVSLSILLVLALAALAGALEFSRAPWHAMPASKEPWRDILERAVIKLVGFFAALSCIALLYWLFPEYRRAYYARDFDAARMIVPLLPFICAPYFIWAEWRLPYEQGGAWHAAMIVLGRWKEVDWYQARKYALSWLVKGFFMPIMFGDVVNNIGLFRATDWNIMRVGFLNSYTVLFNMFIDLELVVVTAGYLFSMRVFDTQVRDVEKTLFGWIVAVISYSPFLSLVYVRYLSYSAQGGGWINLIGAHPLLLNIWAGVILALLALHMWCDVLFGIRFSNLTNRGIVTNGPYRFSKHPAYIIKSIRWWMVSVPFFAASLPEAIRLCSLLLLVNLVYTLRCYTEERLLSRDPTYVAYARWIERHGLLRGLAKRFPVFSYEWRLARWQKQGFVEPFQHNTVPGSGQVVRVEA